MKNILFYLLIVLGFYSLESYGQKTIYSFEPDFRIFTAYAFFNAGGYDKDYVQMDTIRIEIRKYLDTILKKDYRQNIKDYLSKTKPEFNDIGSYVLNLSNDGNFKWICDSSDTYLKNYYNGLDTFLYNFCQKVQLQKMWTKYKSKFDSINYSFQPYAQGAINDIISFTKIDTDYYMKYSDKIHFMSCPLMSHFTAFTYTTNNIMYIIDGPMNSKPGPGSFYHEALHPPINSMTHDHLDLVNKLSQLFICAQKKINGGYNDIESLFNESFIRTIDKYLSHTYYHSDSITYWKSVEDEYKLGFILTFYFYENIPKYLSSGKKLKDYYSDLILNIDVNKEIDRWNNYWRDKKK